MKIKIYLAFALLTLGAVASAQSLKYITYFPIPFGTHATLKVKDVALLGSIGDGYVVVGSSSFKGGGFAVTDSFNANNVKMRINADSNTKVAAGVVVIGSVLNAPTSTNYPGTLQSTGDITVKSSTGLNNPVALEAQSVTSVKGLYWGGYGGFGDGGSAWPSSGCVDLTWRSLKLEGTDYYKTYLVCGSGSAASCDTALRPSTMEICGNCGVRTRPSASCNNGVWSIETWGDCKGEGVCTPYTKESLGGRQERVCSPSCGWSNVYCKYANEKLVDGKCIPA